MAPAARPESWSAEAAGKQTPPSSSRSTCPIALRCTNTPTPYARAQQAAVDGAYTRCCIPRKATGGASTSHLVRSNRSNASYGSKGVPASVMHGSERSILSRVARLLKTEPRPDPVCGRGRCGGAGCHCTCGGAVSPWAKALRDVADEVIAVAGRAAVASMSGEDVPCGRFVPPQALSAV
jgi:hypothetical protein